MPAERPADACPILCAETVGISLASALSTVKAPEARVDSARRQRIGKPPRGAIYGVLRHSRGKTSEWAKPNRAGSN
jgi:hypothetical protein